MSNGHDQGLLENVFPSNWSDPQPAQRYNLVVLGGGTAGLVSAAGAAGLGAKVALVESHSLGGDCLNAGCVPSKALLRTSRAIGELRRAGELGIELNPAWRVDFPGVMERMRRIRAEISVHDSARRLADLGVDVFLGKGRFTGSNSLEVNGKTLNFARAVIATGSSPGSLPFPGLEETGYLTNLSVFDLTKLPPRLAVLGTGPIGCEISQAFARFGSRVTMIGRSESIMTREDPDAALLVQNSLFADGVNLRLNTGVAKVEHVASEKVLHLIGGQGDAFLPVDEILVGAGRKPVVQGLGLDEAGVEFDPKKGVIVDDQLRTSNHHIFSAGDCCLKHKFTHTADAAARIVIQNALFAGSAKLSSLVIPWCTYTQPEVAHVGMYPQDAQQAGIELDTYRVELSDVDRAITDSETQGFLKLYTQKGSDEIMGATLVATHAGDMISQITTAMVGKVGLKTLANVIHPYPTCAEAIKKAADAFNRTRLTPRAQKWLGRWLAWRR